jgi:branched-subunit amino acid ABC-type transport system permease component
MQMLRTIALEIFGLFVEDRCFALATALALGAFALAATTHAIDPRIGGYALFACLAAVLVGGVVYTSRRPGE